MAKPKASSDSPNGQEDRETLREIARLIAEAEPETAAAAPVAAAEGGRAFDTDAIDAARLIEAVPCALAICAGDTLIRANAAFALAFGYAGEAALLAAGGLAAIFPGGQDLAADPSPREDRVAGKQRMVEALTCSRRRVTVRLAVHDIGAEGPEPLKLLVLDPEPAPRSSRPEEPLRPASGAAAGEPGAETATSPATAREETGKKAAGKRRDSRRDAGRHAAPLAPHVLARVSHEVRTPLNSILGFSEIMKDERFGPVGSARYKGYIRDIHASGEYALSLINDLLDLAKLESGGFELNFTSVDVNDVIEECVQLVQPQAGKLKVILRVALSRVPLVLADRRSLKQILLNLLSNAIKFTEAGGQVIVSSRRKASGAVRLRVQDTGVGMSEREIALAMQPFRQLDTVPRKLAGTGLGLPLTKALAAANKARFKLKSCPQAGTCVDLTFPAERIVPT